MAQSLSMVGFNELADVVSETGQFIDARADRQLLPFSVPAYFSFIMAMGFMLAGGAIGVILRKRWGHILLGIYLAMHAALFVNFQEINPKLIGLAVTAAMLLALIYLRPPRSPQDA